MENVSEYGSESAPDPSYPDVPTSDRRSVRAVAAAFRHAARHDGGTSAEQADSFVP